jgi:hypothetical protein
VDVVEGEGLDELGLDQRRDHLQHRLAGEDHGALGHGVDFPGEAQVR